MPDDLVKAAVYVAENQATREALLVDVTCPDRHFEQCAKRLADYVLRMKPSVMMTKEICDESCV